MTNEWNMKIDYSCFMNMPQIINILEVLMILFFVQSSSDWEINQIEVCTNGWQVFCFQAPRTLIHRETGNIWNVNCHFNTVSFHCTCEKEYLAAVKFKTHFLHIWNIPLLWNPVCQQTCKVVITCRRWIMGKSLF